MGAFDWSLTAGFNDRADQDIPANDGAAARTIPSLTRGTMAGTAALIADQGGALVTSGTNNAYVLSTNSEVSAVRPGVALSFWADRDNTGEPTLNVDGTGPRPWKALDGSPLSAGAVKRGILYSVVFSGAVPGSPSQWRMTGGANAAQDVTAVGTRVATIENANLPPRVTVIEGVTASIVSPQQAGGADDGTTANDTAWTAVKSSGKPINLPRFSGVGYRFAGYVSLLNATIDPAPGTTFIAPAAVDFESSFRTSRAMKALLRVGDGDTANYPYQFTPDHRRPRREKAVWLSEGDIDRSQIEDVNPLTAGFNHVTVANGTDAFSSVTPQNVTDHEIFWQLQADNVFRASLLPIRGGQELRWARSGGDYVAGVMVRTTAGYYFFRAGLTGVASLQTKLTGQAATEATNLGWPGYNTDGAYFPGNAFWGVSIIDQGRFCVTINGYRAFGPYPVQGDIVDAGPAFFGNQAATVSASWLNRARRTCEVGGIVSSVLTIGDSTTADIHGDWPSVLAETLDGFNGTRVTVTNYAHGGDSSADQWNKLNTLGVPAGTTHAVVLVGRNDISGGASADDFTRPYMEMILDYLTSRGIQVLLCVPFLAYKRGAAGGRGVNVIREESSARTQMAIAGIGARKGVKVLDLNGLSGPLIGSFATEDPDTSYLRDGLHESAYFYKIVGVAISRALADLTLLRMSADCVNRTLPMSSLTNVYGPLNGWSAMSGSEPAYTIRGSGSQPELSLSGRLIPGTRAAPQQIYRLAPNLRPARQVSFVVESDASNIRVVVSPAGIVTVLGMESTGTYVTLSGIRFALAP